MPNMANQTNVKRDDIPFCGDPECEIHTKYVMDASTKKILKNIGIGVGVVTAGAAVGVGAVVAAPLVIAAAGFGASGVVAGSAAAAVQGWIGSVAAGSLFASLQSAGVVGLAATTNAAVGATVAVAAAGTSGGAVLAVRRNCEVKNQGTQTPGYCRNMLKKMKDYEATDHLVVIRLNTDTKTSKHQIKSNSLLPTPKETVDEEMLQTQIQSCSLENTETFDRILQTPTKIGKDKNAWDQERLNERRRYYDYEKAGVKVDGYDSKYSKLNDSIRTDGQCTTASIIKAVDQETQTQSDEPESSVHYVPSESEADLTSDEEDIYFETEIGDAGAVNTQTYRRPIRLHTEESGRFVRFW